MLHVGLLTLFKVLLLQQPLTQVFMCSGAQHTQLSCGPALSFASFSTLHGLPGQQWYNSEAFQQETPCKYAVDVTSCRYQTKVLNWSPPVSPATRLCCTCCHGNTPGHICGTSPCPDVTLPLWKECPAPTFCHILLCGPNMLTPCDSQGIVLTAFSLHCQVQVHSGIQLL